MHDLQASTDSAGNYGSPHLTHSSLSTMIDRELQALTGGTRWLDVGAGHGRFVRIPIEAGMRTVATEMSDRARRSMEDRYGSIPDFEVRAATDSHDGLNPAERFHVISMISVIHHIPDYEQAITKLVERHLEPGGHFICFQDPLHYPRLGRLRHLASKLAYYSWRITQGQVGRGFKTVLRRLRKQYEEHNPSDMVEYHVVRQGVDEQRIVELLAPHFADVRLVRYWSSQGRLQQWLGDRIGLSNTFGVVAVSRQRAPVSQTYDPGSSAELRGDR